MQPKLTILPLHRNEPSCSSFLLHTHFAPTIFRPSSLTSDRSFFFHEPRLMKFMHSLPLHLRTDICGQHVSHMVVYPMGHMVFFPVSHLLFLGASVPTSTPQASTRTRTCSDLIITHGAHPMHMGYLGHLFMPHFTGMSCCRTHFPGLFQPILTITYPDD